MTDINTNIGMIYTSILMINPFLYVDVVCKS